MSAQLNFKQPFDVHFPTRQKSSKGGSIFKKNSLQWYTDGSKLANGGTGMDIFEPNYTIKMPLDTDTIIFQAEIIATPCQYYAGKRYEMCDDQYDFK